MDKRSGEALATVNLIVDAGMLEMPETRGIYWACIHRVAARPPVGRGADSSWRGRFEASWPYSG